MKHLAIICDGNRRWASKHGFPQRVGYIQGLIRIEECCLWAIEKSIPYLTVYCFSTENWNRTEKEVSGLMELAHEYFANRADWYVAKKIKVRFLGRRDRLEKTLVDKMEQLEWRTKNNMDLTLTICVDYGGRDEIIQAIQKGGTTEKEITSIICKNLPEPDLIIRTGGAKRLSNFLMWQSAYSDLYFLDTLFPDFSHSEFLTAIKSLSIKNYGK